MSVYFEALVLTSFFWMLVFSFHRKLERLQRKLDGVTNEVAECKGNLHCPSPRVNPFKRAGGRRRRH